MAEAETDNEPKRRAQRALHRFTEQVHVEVQEARPYEPSLTTGQDQSALTAPLPGRFAWKSESEGGIAPVG